MNRPIILDAKRCSGPCFPKPEHCPRCHSQGFVPIVYGLPAEETRGRARAGEVVLGGCTFSDANWYCKSCCHEWPQELQWPTDEEYLAFRFRCERHRKRPDLLLRMIIGKLRWWCADLIERRICVPLLIRHGTLHRKLKLKDGGFQYLVRFPDRMVRVRSGSSEAAGLEASCLRGPLAGRREDGRYIAAALEILRRQAS
jgi:hypothetical protein